VETDRTTSALAALAQSEPGLRAKCQQWRIPMLISEVMSKDVKIANPKQSIQDAALMMVEIGRRCDPGRRR
jgi:hypothetical protein